MIKHLIESDNGMKFALDKKQIISLTQALEPYAIAIMMGISDDDVPAFVKEHKKEVNKIMKSKQEINNEKTTNSEPEPEKEIKVSGSDIVSLKDYKQQKGNHS